MSLLMQYNNCFSRAIYVYLLDQLEQLHYNTEKLQMLFGLSLSIGCRCVPFPVVYLTLFLMYQLLTHCPGAVLPISL